MKISAILTDSKSCSHVSAWGVPGVAIKSLRIWMWLRKITGRPGTASLAMGINGAICGSSTTTTWAPPSEGGRSGPRAESQYRLAFSLIQPVTCLVSSSVTRSSGLETPWRILWLVFVIRKMPGRGFGTNLAAHHQISSLDS